MSKEFQKYLEEAQKENIDANRTKNYMLLIRRCFINFMGDEDEFTKEEYLIQFLETYREDFKRDPITTLKNVYILSQYNSYKELLNLAKGNQAKFAKLLETAQKLESVSNTEKLNISLNAEEQLLRSLRDVIREFPKIKGKDLLSMLQRRKVYVADYLKNNLISSIQQNASFLAEFGILDEYIEFANSIIKKLDLPELILSKRGIPADEYGDGKGNTVKYGEKRKCFVKYDETGKEIASGEELDEYYEDYGVVDMFDTDYLKSLSPEDLIMMDMFWRSKYLEERMEMAKAMYVIRDLDLWQDIIGDNENKILSFDNENILEALKRYSNPKSEVEEEQPQKRKIFGRKKKKKDIEESEEKKNKIDFEEAEFLSRVARDVVLQECAVISKLKAKDFSVRTWGTIEQEGDLVEDQITIAIDNANFRGTVLMAVPKSALIEFIGTSDVKLPKYKDTEKIDDLYSSIMSKLYLPASNYFRRQVMKKYKQNPSSVVLAGLAGKKVKTAPNQDDQGER